MDNSLQRTYRYLRLAIAATVLVISVAVAVESVRAGVQPSISAYYFTGARNLFVGALVAAALGLLAISGRGAERALLDAAALFAPLIALVPTACTSGSGCLPDSIRAEVDTALATYVIAGTLLLGAASVIAGLAARRGETTERGRMGFAISVAITIVVIVVIAIARLVAEAWFFTHAHLAVTVTFFSIIGAVAVLSAVPERMRHAPREAGVSPASRRQKTVYAVIATALVVDIVILIIVVSTDVTSDLLPPVLVGEFIALALFCVFWIVQSSQKWNDVAPRAWSGTDAGDQRG